MHATKVDKYFYLYMDYVFFLQIWTLTHWEGLSCEKQET